MAKRSYRTPIILIANEALKQGGFRCFGGKYRKWHHKGRIFSLVTLNQLVRNGIAERVGDRIIARVPSIAPEMAQGAILGHLEPATLDGLSVAVLEAP